MDKGKGINLTQFAVAATMLALAVGSFSGCSVVMAAKQPGKKDLSVLEQGTPRGSVIAELGAPKWSEEENGKNVDIFTFVQGYSTPAKAGRALFHGAADVFTFGLWEVVGTPTEAVFDGTELKVKVSYDENDNVESVEYLNQPPQRAERNQNEDDSAQKEENAEDENNSVPDQDFSK